MNSLFEAAREVCEFMDSHKWKYCIIGGLAVVRWGEQRNTLDVDFNLLTGFGKEERFADTILTAFQSRLANSRAFALERRVLLIRAANGIPVDLSLGAFPYEERLISRATPFEFAPGYAFLTCSAEDLVVMKAFANRQRDWQDIEMIKVRQGKHLDWRLILREIAPLAEAKDTPEIQDRLRRLSK